MTKKLDIKLVRALRENIPEMYECLAEFVRIDDDSGLYAYDHTASDLVQALDKARKLTGQEIDINAKGFPHE